MIRKRELSLQLGIITIASFFILLSCDQPPEGSEQLANEAREAAESAKAYEHAPNTMSRANAEFQNAKNERAKQDKAVFKNYDKAKYMFDNAATLFRQTEKEAKTHETAMIRKELGRDDFPVNEQLNDFRPSVFPQQLGTINARNAIRAPCASPIQNRTAKWPSIGNEDPIKIFSRRVQASGATNGVWAVLELDPLSIEAALQIALMSDIIDKRQLQALRATASRSLIKPNARTFILMHNSDVSWWIGSSEPFLLSERSGRGRLVGISGSFANGLERKQLGVLMFENRVCRQDISYVLDISLWYKPENIAHYRFTFGANENIAAVLAAAYAPYLPSYKQLLEQKAANNPSSVPILPSLRSEENESSLFSWLGLAFDIVGLLLAVLK
jgi:hypothetical protein